MKRLLIFFTLATALLTLTAVAFAQDDEDTTPRTPEAICDAATPADEPESREYAAPPAMALERGVDYYALLCTGYGPVFINLFETLTPVTVNNFVALAEDGYFNNLTFHRVIDDFMAQGGDPLGTGTGGPGYQFEDEFNTFLTFDRPGLLAMANSGPNTNGSQFFVTTAITDWLTYGHTIFGEVIFGQDNVTAIPATEVEPDVALDTVVIITDLSTVDIDFTPPTPASREALTARLDDFPDVNTLVLDTDASTDYDSADFVALLPDDLQEAAGEFFAQYNHDFTLVVNHNNEACDLEEIPLESLNYQIHVFETAEDARQATLDDTLMTLLSAGNADAEGFTLEYSSMAGQTWQTESACLDETVERAAAYRQLGRFIIFISATYPNDAPFDAQVLDGINIDLYDAVFFAEFRTEASQ